MTSQWRDTNLLEWFQIFEFDIEACKQQKQPLILPFPGLIGCVK